MWPPAQPDIVGRMRRILIALCVLGPLAAVGWSGLDTAAHRWSWRAADLDRNRLDLAYYRGAETGDALAGWVEHGDVVAASGRSAHTQGGDAEVLVRYEREDHGWLAGSTPTIETDCYRFSFVDRHQTSFRRVDCPR